MSNTYNNLSDAYTSSVHIFFTFLLPSYTQQYYILVSLYTSSSLLLFPLLLLLLSLSCSLSAAIFHSLIYLSCIIFTINLTLHYSFSLSLSLFTNALFCCSLSNTIQCHSICTCYFHSLLTVSQSLTFSHFYHSVSLFSVDLSVSRPFALFLLLTQSLMFAHTTTCSHSFIHIFSIYFVPLFMHVPWSLTIYHLLSW